MISNSKILTVSYGTFSCTLEGFDDSFGTMKAIAEYFRDLAAEDRYFGAEPPTPDAEMLARIAEREIARRVEARQDGSNFVLRAQNADAANLLSRTDAEHAAPKAPGEVSYTAAQPQKVRVPEPEPGPVTGAPEAPETAEEPADEPMADPQAAAPVSIAPAEADPVAEDAGADAQADVSEDTEAEGVTVDADVAADIEEAFEGIEDLQPEDLQAETANEPDLAEIVTEETSEAEPEAPVAAQEDDIAPADPESVAAKLRRIRSVVAQSGSDFGYDYNEDEHAQDFLSSTASDLDAALAEDDAAEAARAEHGDENMDDVPQDAPQAGETRAQDPAPDGDDDDATASILANVASETEARTVAEADAEIAQEVPDEDDELGDTLAQLLADAMPDADRAEAADEPRAGREHTVDEECDIEDGDEELTAPESAARPLDARVMKIKRASIEGAIASGMLEAAPAENLFSEEDTIGGDDDDFDSTLSPEEEDELQRELAAVEAEYTPARAQANDSDVDDTFAADWEDEASEGDGDHQDAARAEDAPVNQPETSSHDGDEPNSPEAYRRSAQQGVEKLQRMKQDSDLSRIFEEADTKLEAPDSSKRRNAIQHLRAAVAATRADKQAGKSVDTDFDEVPYRTDLAEVVRPRRPQTQLTARSERPGMERPAPLKLVAEQRIDTPREPIRPRRVSTQELDSSNPHQGENGSSFAEFAEEMGVSSLPELLEAAAAFMADIEGRPQFSRPMLMGKLKEVEGNAFSREDSLRSFGQLLRQGKLQKLNGGRFAVTEDTDFRAPKRNVG